MPTNEPIKQPVEVVYEGEDAQAAARDMKAVGNAAEKSGEQAAKSTPKLKTREQQLASQRARLEQLLRSEDRYEQALNDGRRVSDRATEASRRRKREIDKLSRSLAAERRVQDRATASVRRHAVAADTSAASAGRLGGVTGALTGRFASVGASLLGTGGLIAALGILGRDLEERTRQTRDFLDANLELQFLSDSFNGQERDFLASASIFGGQDPSETTRAFTQLKSRFPGQSDEALQGLFLEILETGRATTAPLTPLTDAFSGLFQATGDAQASQNILRETIIQAGQADPQVITTLLGKFIGPGTGVLGLTAGESAGGVAGVTGLTTQRPEEQVQGLLTFLLNIKGKGTPDINEILEGAGIDRTSGDALEVASRVLDAVDRGKISIDQFETLTGREGIKIGSALLDPSRRTAFFEKVRKVAEQEFNTDDPTAQAIADQFQDDPRQALNFAIKQAETQAKVANSQDQGALEAALARQLLDNELKSRGKNAVSRFLAEKSFDTAAALGVGSEAATTVGANAGTLTTPVFPLSPIQPGSVQDNADQRDIRDAVSEGVSGAASGQILVNKVEINRGTIVNNGRDPLTADLDQGRPRR